MSQRTKRNNTPAPWLYLFGVLAWTWALQGAAIFTGQHLFAFPTLALTILGALGPVLLPGLLIAAGRWDASRDQSAVEFYRRAFDPRTLPWRWYLIVLGLVLVVSVGPVLLDTTVRREHGLINLGPGLFIVIGVLFGALEEPGWRGYAQEGLQRRLPVVVSSLVIGCFWAAWHLPLFFIPGTYQAGLGVNTAAFWAFTLALVLGSPLYAWLYNAAGRVVFAAILFHALGNAARELVPDVDDMFEVGVEAALALIAVAASWKWMCRRFPNSASSAQRDQARTRTHR